jgi:putative glycosyltransferase (TIGR04348 family)
VKIQLVTPAPLRFNNGNKITALRWSKILKNLGHRVRITQRYDDERCDILIALHARRSHSSIVRFQGCHPELPLIVVLTGTDVYRDIHTRSNARQSLELATRIVGLQKMVFTELPKRLHAKTRVIYQSAEPIKTAQRRRRKGVFRVSVIGHLRQEKDPLRTALAVRNLPSESRTRVVHIGRALEDHLKKRARHEMERNSRYRWLGELTHWQTRRVLCDSDATVITSRIEGSSNVLSEALACAVPVIASRISGLIGTLGRDYPGYFPVGDTRALSRILRRAEIDAAFYRSLKSAAKELSTLISPRREVAAWKELLTELSART